jgi:hypothetical protein
MLIDKSQDGYIVKGEDNDEEGLFPEDMVCPEEAIEYAKRLFAKVCPPQAELSLDEIPF